MENNKRQSLTTEQFFYFFLRLRKGEVRKTVESLQNRYPEETPEQLVARLITAKSRLSLLGGTLLQVPALVPGVGQVLKLAGLVGASSMLTRIHLHLILEIALVYGKDIDDTARVGELAAVVATIATAAAAPSLLHRLQPHPLFAIPMGAMSSIAATKLIGFSAVKFYRREMLIRQMEEARAAAAVPV